MSEFRAPTPQELEAFVEKMTDIDGQTSWTPIEEDDAMYEDYEEEDYEEEPMMWYFGLEFFVEEDTGEVGYNVEVDDVSSAQMWSGAGNKEDSSLFLAEIPVSPGDEISLKEVLDEMFSQGYDSPYR